MLRARPGDVSEVWERRGEEEEEDRNTGHGAASHATGTVVHDGFVGGVEDVGVHDGEGVGYG